MVDSLAHVFAVGREVRQKKREGELTAAMVDKFRDAVQRLHVQRMKSPSTLTAIIFRGTRGWLRESELKGRKSSSLVTENLNLSPIKILFKTVYQA